MFWLLGKAAIVKLYDVPEGEIKLTDLLDIVGVISLDPAMALSEPNETSIFPPPSLVPRLHVIHFQKVSLGVCTKGLYWIFFRRVMINLTAKCIFFILDHFYPKTQLFSPILREQKTCKNTSLVGKCSPVACKSWHF